MNHPEVSDAEEAAVLAFRSHRHINQVFRDGVAEGVRQTQDSWDCCDQYREAAVMAVEKERKRVGDMAVAYLKEIGEHYAADMLADRLAWEEPA